MVKTSHSNAGGTDLTPGWRVKISHVRVKISHLTDKKTKQNTSNIIANSTKT